MKREHLRRDNKSCLERRLNGASKRRYCNFGWNIHLFHFINLDKFIDVIVHGVVFSLNVSDRL
jgi:hypothetical protein